MNQNNQDAFDAGTISVSYKTSGSGGNSQSGTSKVAILKDQKGNQQVVEHLMEVVGETGI